MNKSINRIDNIPPQVLLSATVMLLALLTGCGGGSDSTSTAESSSDGMKTALGVSGSATVPSPWKGRAPKMEVINGITVPPEPAPTINNSTLAGVDVNLNGIRDDIERNTAIIYPTTYNSAIRVMSSQEAFMESTGSPQILAEELRVAECAKFSAQRAGVKLTDESVNSVVLTSVARKESYGGNLAKIDQSKPTPFESPDDLCKGLQ